MTQGTHARGKKKKIRKMTAAGVKRGCSVGGCKDSGDETEGRNGTGEAARPARVGLSAGAAASLLSVPAHKHSYSATTASKQASPCCNSYI